MSKTKLRDNQKSDNIDLATEVTGVLTAANGGTGLNTLIGNEGKILKVKADASGFELANEGAGGGGISEADAIALAVAL